MSKNNNYYRFGPQNKSEETKLLESIIEAAILDREQLSLTSYHQQRTNPDFAMEFQTALKNIQRKNPDFTMEFQTVLKNIPLPEANYKQKLTFLTENDQLMVRLLNEENKIINITLLMDKVNLNHIALSDEALARYEGLYENQKIFSIRNKIPSREEFKQLIEDADLSQQTYLPQLSHAEKLAIRSYTTGNYGYMNDFLRGYKIPKDPIKALIDIAISSQGLNKVWDIELPKVIRYQGKSRVNEMISKVNSGEIDQVRGYISTSHGVDNTSDGDTVIIYTNIRGKKISAISDEPDEDEYLIPPSTQVKYTSHKIVGKSDIFTAEGVNVLLDGPKAGKAAEAINLKATKLEQKVKEDGYFSDKNILEFSKDCTEIIYKNNLINYEICNKYLNELNKQLPEPVLNNSSALPKLSNKDKPLVSAHILSQRLGLQALTDELDSHMSPEAKDFITKQKKLKEVIKDAKKMLKDVVKPYGPKTPNNSYNNMSEKSKKNANIR